MRTNLIIILLSLSILVGCRNEGNIQPAPGGHADQAAKTVNQFAVDLYQKLAQEDGNLFFSPTSISSALAMTWTGTRGTTAAEFSQVLHLNGGREQTLADFSQLLGHLDGEQQKYTLKVANRLWGQKEFSFKSEFVTDIEQYFGGGFQSVNFRKNPDHERVRINRWVADQTADKIKDLLPDGSITIDTRLVLTNAVYFLGKWAIPFPEEQTGAEAFHLANGTSMKTPMMKLEEEFGYYSDETLALISLPYQGLLMDFLIILPHDVNGLPRLETGLTEADLDTWIHGMRSRQVDLWLPRMELSQSFNLNGKLQQLGLEEAFLPGKADFAGLSDQQGLFISSVVHQSFLKVDEKGTEAAAATGITIAVTSMPAPPVRFIADHAFLFLIRHKPTGAILFMGRLENPTP